MRSGLIAFLLFALAAVAVPARAGEDRSQNGAFETAEATGVWHDAARGRDVPYKITYAPGAPGPRPIVIFSHGLGGNRDAAVFLMRHLASWGYVAVNLQHPGSDESIWRGKDDPVGAIREWFKDRRNLAETTQARFGDLSFAIDELARMAASDPTFKGRLNLDRIGMSGHSFGAISTLAAAGQMMGPKAFERSFAEPRIRAGIAYSPSPPMRREDFAHVYGAIRIPLFHMTGTEDGDPVGDRFPAEGRQTPFREISGPEQYLLVLAGGDHMVFNGRRWRGQTEKSSDARHQALIKLGTLAFWDAYLMDNAEARAWLRDGGFAAAVAGDGTVAVK